MWRAPFQLNRRIALVATKITLRKPLNIVTFLMRKPIFIGIHLSKAFVNAS